MQPDFNAFTKYRLKSLRALLNYHRIGITDKKAKHWLSYSHKYMAKANACIKGCTVKDIASFKLTTNWQRVDKYYTYVHNTIRRIFESEERRDKFILMTFLVGGYKTIEEKVGLTL